MPDSTRVFPGAGPRGPGRITAARAAGHTLALTLALLAWLLPGRVLAGPHQVWLLVDVVENDDSPGEFRLKIPLQWVKDDESITACDEDPGRHTLDGRRIYRTYRDLRPGRQERIDSFRCGDARVEVRVMSERLKSRRQANRLHLQVRSEEGEKMNISVPFSTLTALKELFSGNLFRIESGYGEELTEALDGDLGLLGSLPPFELLRIRGDEESVVLRTE